MGTEQSPSPEQAPPQPVNDEPASGVAVRPTVVPGAKEAEQAPEPPALQSIPEGELETSPFPDTETVNVCAARLKAAVMDSGDRLETAHAPVPEQPLPLQPAKTDPEAGTAVKAT